jgi:hypothetical protein
MRRGLPPPMREQIVNFHNDRRRLVAKGWIRNQPPAANMAKLVGMKTKHPCCVNYLLSCKQSLLLTRFSFVFILHSLSSIDYNAILVLILVGKT